MKSPVVVSKGLFYLKIQSQNPNKIRENPLYPSHPCSIFLKFQTFTEIYIRMNLKTSIPSFIIASILLSIFTTNLAAQIPEGFCVSQQEYALYRKINDYRQSQGMQVIPISKSLCYVAKMHMIDLYENHPDTSYCNLNSWSDKGPWTACCHSNYKPEPECILNKPKEITSYPGQAHELAYYDSDGIQVDTVFRFWMKVGQAKDILTNNRKWSLYTWQAMGVGIYKHYACVWLGDVQDVETEPMICQGEVDINEMDMPGKQKVSKIVKQPTDRFYLIFGSFTTETDAMNAVEKYRQEGFYQAKVVVKDESFRVSLSDHATMQEARDAKTRLGGDYREAWIIKF